MDVTREHEESDLPANVVLPGVIDLPAYQLLLQPFVQEALHLSQQQQTSLQDISAHYWPERRQIAGKELADTESARQKDWPRRAAKAHHGLVSSNHFGDRLPFSKEFIEKLERQWSDARKQIEDVLTPEQLRTLKDLTFRTFAFGSGVMFEPDVLQRLDVDNNQRDPLRELDRRAPKGKTTPASQCDAGEDAENDGRLDARAAIATAPNTDAWRRSRGGLLQFPVSGASVVHARYGSGRGVGVQPRAARRVRKIVDAHWMRLIAMSQEEQNLPLGDEKVFKAIGEKRRQEMADLRKQIEAALTPEQWASCKRMALENLAMPSLHMAAHDPQALSELGLGEQQRTALREIEAEYFDKPQQIYCELTDKALAAFTPRSRKSCGRKSTGGGGKSRSASAPGIAPIFAAESLRPRGQAHFADVRRVQGGPRNGPNNEPVPGL